MSVNAIVLGIGRFNIEVKTIEVVVIKGKRINSLSHTESVRLEYYVFLTQRFSQRNAECLRLIWVLILALAKGFEHPGIEFCIIFGMAAD